MNTTANTLRELWADDNEPSRPNAIEDPFTGMPGYEPDAPQPEFLQEAVNLNIELNAAMREIEQLKTFLKELHLLTAYQDWKAEQETNQNEQI